MTEGHIGGDMGAGRKATMRVDYPGNANKAKVPKEERKRPTRVVEGTVVKRKKNVLDRAIHNVFSEDTGSVGNYLVMEVLLPAFRNFLYDFASQGAERLLYGEGRKASRTGYTNYARASERGGYREREREPLSRRARATHDFDDIVIASRLEAEEVIDALRELIDRFQQATVADLYDLVGLTGEYTDEKWGWTDLRNASARPIRGGYLLSLPRPSEI